MIQPELLKDLERRGFSLNYPDTISQDEKILSILKEENPRYLLALPLLLREEFNYEFIIKKLGTQKLENTFQKIILISWSIFADENIPRTHLQSIIHKHKLTLKETGITSDEIETYHHALREAMEIQGKNGLKEQEESIKLRSKLNLNQSLSIIFSPSKLRIMQKIFNHEKLTQSELKYYYRSIKPLAESIQNENLQEYLRIITSIKKHT